MKEKIKQFLVNDGVYLGLFFILMIITLLISTVTYKVGDYTLNLPNQTLYGCIVYAVVIICSIIYFNIFRKIDRKNLKLYNIYLCIVIPLGIMYCLANPLGKVPDEDHHARKAIAISQGNIFSKASESGEAVENINAKIAELVTRSTSSYEEAYNRIIAAETNKMIPMSYNTMALYAPVCHAPQAIGFFFARMFGASIVLQCYIARLCNMVVAIFLIYLAIKLIPFKKHIVIFLGLLPITLNEIASMSSDALTISIILFFISYILYLKYDDNKKDINNVDIIILGISSIIVALCKIVYLPICLLLFILPTDKFKSKKIKYIVTSGIFVLSVILNLVWLVYCSRFLIQFNPGVNSSEQVKYILSNPIRYAFIVFRTMNVYNQTFIMSLCGEGLGSYNVQASVLYVFPCIAFFASLIFINDDKERKPFDLFTKLYFLFVFLAVIALIYTSLYVQWTPYGSNLILGIQSRYFLPLVLLTAIFFDNKVMVFNSKFSNRYLFIFMLFFNLNALSCILYSYMNCLIEYYVK